MEKRILGLVLAVMMCLTLLPATAFAEGEGESTYAHSINGGLDLTAAGTPSNGDGYAWTGNETDGYQLTLSGIEIKGDLKLPNTTNRCKITITTTVASSVTGKFDFNNNYSYNLFFEGSAALNIGGDIDEGSDGDAITIQNGADVTVGGRIETGGSGGANGTIIVTGTGSSLTVEGKNASSMLIENLQIFNGGKMHVKCSVDTSSVTVEGENSSIDVNVTSGPAIALMNYSSENTSEETKAAFANALNPLLPDGYTVGEKSNSYTVLDSEDNIATSLTLQPAVEPTFEPAQSSGNAYIYANGRALILAAGKDETTQQANANTVIYIDRNRNGEIDDGDYIWAPLGNLYDKTTVGNDLKRFIIFGGTKDTALTGDTKITMLGGKVAGICGGGRTDSSVTGNTSVTVSGGTLTGDVYGGGYYGTITGDTTVTVTGGTVKSVYGGGYGDEEDSGQVNGNTTVSISGNAVIDGENGGGVYGGGTSAEVTGNTTVTISDNAVIGDTTKGGSVYGGGWDGNVGGNVTVTMTGGTICSGEYPGYIGTITGGGYNGTVSDMISMSLTGGSVGLVKMLYSGNCVCEGSVSLEVGGNVHIGIETVGGVCINANKTDGYPQNGVASFAISSSSPLSTNASIQVILPSYYSFDTTDNPTVVTNATENDMDYFKWPAMTGFPAGTEAFYENTCIKIGKKPVAVTEVTLSQTALSLEEGKTASLTATVQPDNATNKAVTWSSSDETIATVDETGKVTAVAPGTATITATTADSSKTATCTVTVTKPASGGSSGGGGGAATTYPVTTDDPPHGTVKADPERAKEGATVTLTVTPEEGYTIDGVTVTDQDGKEIPVTDQGDGQYTFPMPAGKVTVSASFLWGDTGYAACPKDETCPIWPFTDASPTAWYHDGVHYCIDNGLMGGYPGNLFGPDDATTRAMIVTILYRLEGQPAASGAPFSDVPAGQYYTDPVAWAAEQGIVNGYGDGTFGPEDPITREQLAAIFYRYADYKGCDMTARGDLSGYTDADQISPYAMDAMAWASGEGLFTGTSATTLDPAGTTTRAQAATVLMRCCVNVAK